MPKQDNMASNNWVIHGKHTETGKPLLAADPHLGTGIPSVWFLMEVSVPEFTTIGNSFPGVPGTIIGRGNHASWGLTACLVDLADLYREELNAQGTQYKVDGDWRSLTIRDEVIKVRGSEAVHLKVRKTHRGPILDEEVLGKAQLLFGALLPPMIEKHSFSLAWTGYQTKDNTFNVLDFINKAKSAKEVEDFLLREGYYSVPQSMVAAFDNGDIAYVLAAMYPNRKGGIPFQGSQVLDGTTSKFDWDGLVPFKDMPRVINPEKGFIVTANNRAVPEHVAIDAGATLMSTTRAKRITEIIQNGIDAGKKFTIQDMIDIQQDEMDVEARDLISYMLSSVQSNKNRLSKGEVEAIEALIPHLNHWKGDTSAMSIGATVYNVWYLHFIRTLFRVQIQDEPTRLDIFNNYQIKDFISSLIMEAAENPSASKYNRFCVASTSDKQGSPCALNLAKALAETKTFLEKHLSKHPRDWRWDNLHVNEYSNMPWSRIPVIRNLFHREVPVGGNGNTPHVSKFSWSRSWKEKFFRATHTANYKFVQLY